MNCVVKARARLDLKKHWRYIAHDNPDAADRFLQAAEETFGAIVADPAIGSQRSFRRLAGIRSRPVVRFGNYLVFYQHRTDEVVILRVLHGMMNLPRFFSKRLG
jgi:toxin ParE1/3/4